MIFCKRVLTAHLFNSTYSSFVINLDSCNSVLYLLVFTPSTCGGNNVSPLLFSDAQRHVKDHFIIGDSRYTVYRQFPGCHWVCIYDGYNCTLKSCVFFYIVQ